MMLLKYGIKDINVTDISRTDGNNFHYNCDLIITDLINQLLGNLIFMDVMDDVALICELYIHVDILNASASRVYNLISSSSKDDTFTTRALNLLKYGHESGSISSGNYQCSLKNSVRVAQQVILMINLEIDSGDIYQGHFIDSCLKLIDFIRQQQESFNVLATNIDALRRMYENMRYLYEKHVTVISVANYNDQSFIKKLIVEYISSCFVNENKDVIEFMVDGRYIESLGYSRNEVIFEMTRKTIEMKLFDLTLQCFSV